MAVIAKPQVSGLPALSPCPLPGGGGQPHHLPGSLLLPLDRVDPPLLCRSREPGGPGIAGKGYANTDLRSSWEQGKVGGGEEWREDRRLQEQSLTSLLCLPPEKVFTGCYLKRPQRTSTRTLSSTRWTRGRGTQTSTQTASGPIR